MRRFASLLFIAAFAFALAFAFAACDDDPASPEPDDDPEPEFVDVEVTGAVAGAETGEPIGGAAVAVYLGEESQPAGEDETAADGSYEISFEIEEGEEPSALRVEASASGFAPAEVTAAFASSVTEDLALDAVLEAAVSYDREEAYFGEMDALEGYDYLGEPLGAFAVEVEAASGSGLEEIRMSDNAGLDTTVALEGAASVEETIGREVAPSEVPEGLAAVETEVEVISTAAGDTTVGAELAAEVVGAPRLVEVEDYNFWENAEARPEPNPHGVLELEALDFTQGGEPWSVRLEADSDGTIEGSVPASVYALRMGTEGGVEDAAGGFSNLSRLLVDKDVYHNDMDLAERGVSVDTGYFDFEDQYIFGQEDWTYDWTWVVNEGQDREAIESYLDLRESGLETVKETVGSLSYPSQDVYSPSDNFQLTADARSFSGPGYLEQIAVATYQDELYAAWTRSDGEITVLHNLGSEPFNVRDRAFRVRDIRDPDVREELREAGWDEQMLPGHSDSAFGWQYRHENFGHYWDFHSHILNDSLHVEGYEEGELPVDPSFGFETMRGFSFGAEEFPSIGGVEVASPYDFSVVVDSAQNLREYVREVPTGRHLVNLEDGVYATFLTGGNGLEGSEILDRAGEQTDPDGARLIQFAYNARSGLVPGAFPVEARIGGNVRKFPCDEIADPIYTVRSGSTFCDDFSSNPHHQWSYSDLYMQLLVGAYQAPASTQLVEGGALPGFNVSVFPSE